MLDLQQFELEKVVKGLEVHVSEFFETREKEFETLKASILRADFSAAAAITHNWKGFCAPYGFGYLGKLAAEAEAAIKSKDLGSIDQKLLSIEEYFKAKKVRLSLNK